MNTIAQTREELKTEPYREIPPPGQLGYEVRNLDNLLIYRGQSTHLARLLHNIKSIA